MTVTSQSPITFFLLFGVDYDVVVVDEVDEIVEVVDEVGEPSPPMTIRARFVPDSPGSTFPT